MKTFIFLSVLVISFFIYLFVFLPAQEAKKSAYKPSSKELSLQGIEKAIEEKFEKKARPDIQKEDEPKRFSKNLQNSIIYMQEPAAAVQPISENITFDTLVDIISSIRPNYPKTSISLNTPMNSLLPTDTQKREFIEKLENDFKIPTEKSQKLMKKNRLLWDWVNTLKER